MSSFYARVKLEGTPKSGSYLEKARQRQKQLSEKTSTSVDSKESGSIDSKESDLRILKSYHEQLASAIATNDEKKTLALETLITNLQLKGLDGEVGKQVTGLTSDLEKGLEGWDKAEIENAKREGRSPQTIDPLKKTANLKEVKNTLVNYLASSPELETHFKKTLANGKTKLRFDVDAKEAYYDKSGDGTIILPVNQAPLDLLDGLIFETCNVENQKEFNDLDTDFKGGDGKGPMPFAEYGERKAVIESKTFLKQVQLLFNLKEAETPLAYQGQRNLDKAAATAIKARLSQGQGAKTTGREDRYSEILDYIDSLLAVDAKEGAVNPPKRNEELDALIRAELQDSLSTLGSGAEPEMDAAFVKEFINTPHNSRAKETDKNGLSSTQMYAYEKMEMPPGQLQELITTQLESAYKQETGNEVPGLPLVEKWVRDRFMKLDVGQGEESLLGRQQILLDTIDELPKLFPEIAGKLDLKEYFGFTPEMIELAKKRFEKMVTENSDRWNKIKDQLPTPNLDGGSEGVDKEGGLKALAEALSKPVSREASDTVQSQLTMLGVPSMDATKITSAWDRIVVGKGKPDYGLTASAPDKKKLLPILKALKIVIDKLDAEVGKVLIANLYDPLNQQVGELPDAPTVVKKVPLGGKVPTTSPPQVAQDEEIEKYLKLGVPRAIVKNTSKECLEKIDELAKAKGDPDSEAYEFLWAVLGKSKADLIRTRLAEGGPHEEKNQNKIALAKLFDAKHVPPDEKTINRYKEQMSRATDGNFGAVVEEAHKHLLDNETQYPESKNSCDAIRNLPPEQQVALCKYTAATFKRYNKEILFRVAAGQEPKDTDLTDCMDGITFTLAALQGLPPVACTVWRNDERKYFDDHQVGAVVSRMTLTSTSADEAAVLKGSGMDCLMELRVKSGRDISGCSQHPEEKEILLPPGLSFRVINREEVDSKLKLTLEEV